MSRRHRSREQRSRSRRRSRSRSRSRRRSTSRRVRHRSPSQDEFRRSVSGDLTRGEDQIHSIKQIVEQQQDVILNLLTEHKAEVDGKITAKSRRFASRQIDKQFQVNANFKELAQKALVALAASEVVRTKELLTTLVEDLEKHEEDLIIADTSPHGWLAVAKVRSGQELPKTLRKKLAQVEKDLSARRNGGFKKKSNFFSNKNESGSGRRFNNNNGNRRISPEEAIANAAKQSRPGTCSHCNKNNHFYRECPLFWGKVLQSRETHTSANATAS
jgi:hypothetical protein